MPAECPVGTAVSDTLTESVEISGWDAEGQFFVEIADLEVSKSGDTIALLCHGVNNGSLVFVRLLHGHGQQPREKGDPSAHETQAIEPPDATGRCRIRLTPCQPRAARRRGD